MGNITVPGPKARRGRVMTLYLEGGSEVNSIRASQLQAVCQAAGSHPSFEAVGWRLTPTGGEVRVRCVVNPIPVSTVVYLALGGIGVFTLTRIGEGIKEGVSGWFGVRSASPDEAADQASSWWQSLKAGVPPLQIAAMLWHRYLEGDKPTPTETATASESVQTGASGSW